MLLGFSLVATLAILVLVILIVYFFTLYNSLVQVRVNVDTAWSNIDVLLKQRHDELGKLLDATKSYMSFESGLLQQITQLRGQTEGGGSGPARIQAESALSAGLGRLFAVSENYPQLRSSESFQQLEGSINSLETEIAHRREFYNAAVNVNNTRAAQFPDMIVAPVAGVVPRTLFSAPPSDIGDVDVAAGLSR
jgi:LemA protein